MTLILRNARGQSYSGLVPTLHCIPTGRAQVPLRYHRIFSSGNWPSLNEAIGGTLPILTALQTTLPKHPQLAVSP
jgi:hypothetical protein